MGSSRGGGRCFFLGWVREMRSEEWLMQRRAGWHDRDRERARRAGCLLGWAREMRPEEWLICAASVSRRRTRRRGAGMSGPVRARWLDRSPNWKVWPILRGRTQIRPQDLRGNPSSDHPAHARNWLRRAHRASPILRLGETCFLSPFRCASPASHVRCMMSACDLRARAAGRRSHCTNRGRAARYRNE
jgi:hypothetical protein